MLLNSALSISFLLATAVSANLHRRKHPHNKSPKHANQTVEEEILKSNNWAGAVLPGSFNSVSAVFTVPVPSGNVGSAASAWVGLDGYLGCENALLQTGVNFIVGDNNEPSYQAWYEWVPDGARFYDFTVSAGDTIKLSVSAWSSTKGWTMIENLGNGKNSIQLVESSHALCGQTAEWIVEDYLENGSRVPFANFGSVSFTSPQAFTSDGTPTAPDGADTVTIVQSGRTMTSISFDSSSVNVTAL